LNQWQVNFVVNILGVEQHTECFTPTPSQKTKVVECLDKLTAAIVQHTESENNRSIQDNANVARTQLELIKEFVRITVSEAYLQTEAVAERLTNVLIRELREGKKLAALAGEDCAMFEAHRG
jgi:hypothetical protein